MRFVGAILGAIIFTALPISKVDSGIGESMSVILFFLFIIVGGIVGGVFEK